MTNLREKQKREREEKTHRFEQKLCLREAKYLLGCKYDRRYKSQLLWNKCLMLRRITCRTGSEIYFNRIYLSADGRCNFYRKNRGINWIAILFIALRVYDRELVKFLDKGVFTYFDAFLTNVTGEIWRIILWLILLRHAIKNANLRQS